MRRDPHPVQHRQASNHLECQTIDEIVVAPQREQMQGDHVVRVFGADGAFLEELVPFPGGRSACRVSCADVDGDGVEEILTAEGVRSDIRTVRALSLDGSLVTEIDPLFASGSARLNAALYPAIERIAAALDSVPGAVVVTGHTDDVPIRSARFPSNWELSMERARSVVALMSGRLRDPARLRAELEMLLVEEFRGRLARALEGGAVRAALDRVVAGEQDPYAAAAEIWPMISLEGS